jgi:hypothetical protein
LALGPSLQIIYRVNALTAARVLGVQVQVLNASTERDLAEAYASLAKMERLVA